MIRVCLSLTLLLAVPLVGHARQHAVRNGGKDYVVHSRVGPVLMHRALPPFKGQHVYEGRAER